MKVNLNAYDQLNKEICLASLQLQVVLLEHRLYHTSILKVLAIGSLRY